MAERDEILWTEHLGQDECWSLLASTGIGRLGVLVDSAPEIYPVNFTTVDRTVVFRTEEGTKRRGLTRSPSVCFEVDRIDELEREGWSVMVKGRADEVDVATLPGDIGDRLQAWAVDEGSAWIRIRPDDVTGRRIGHSRHRRQV